MAHPFKSIHTYKIYISEFIIRSCAQKIEFVLNRERNNCCPWKLGEQHCEAVYSLRPLNLPEKPTCVAGYESP
jgi:hypothetical protein